MPGRRQTRRQRNAQLRAELQQRRREDEARRGGLSTPDGWPDDPEPDQDEDDA